MNYVDQYLRLDERASAAESKVEEYRSRAEENRWEQCRIAYEAVDSGEFSRASFAREVRTSASTITRQFAVWSKWGSSPLAVRPTYRTAVDSTDGPAETDRKQISNARAVLKNPAAARELLSDPVVRAVAAEAIQSHRRAEPTTRTPAPSGDAAFLRCVDDMARVEQSLVRLTENVNEGRKNGYLTPAVLREFVEKLRLYAEAIEEIAGSRGLTDEALYEWIGES